MHSTLAKNVKDGTRTSSPSLIPRAIRLRVRASVPEFNVTTYFVFRKFFMFSSKIFTLSLVLVKNY